MKTQLFILSLIFLVSACNFGETKKLEKCLQTTIKKNDCLIALDKTSNNGKTTLKLKTQCDVENGLIYGKIMFDFLKEAKKNDLDFDNYIVESKSNQLMLSFDRKTQRLSLRKKDF